MRLKYQLRGLGIGIILTAALLMIFSDDGEASAKTDSEMIVASTEAETTEETVEVESSVVLPEETVVQEETSTVEAEEMQTEITTSEEETASEITEEDSVDESVVEESTVEETTTEVVSTETESTETVADDADVVTIKIVSGDDSGTVARKLQTAGLVDNASEYDAYLMQHGYDKRISVGEVKIKLGSSWLEIAEKISGK